MNLGTSLRGRGVQDVWNAMAWKHYEIRLLQQFDGTPGLMHLIFFEDSSTSTFLGASPYLDNGYKENTK